MRIGAALACCLLLAAPLAARDRIGIYQGWGAWRDPPGSGTGERCMAIATPDRWVRRKGAQPWLAIASWPREGRRAEVHAALSAPRRPGSALTLTVGGRRFVLAGQGSRASAPDRRTDRSIVAAIRAARSLSVEGLGRDGRAIVEVYDLAGAPSAIDAAAIACAVQKR